MKKKIILILTVILAISTVILTACTQDEANFLDDFREGVNGMANAKEISRKIEVKKNDFLQYEREENFAKTENGFSVTGTERKLNGSSAAEMWNETAISEEKEGIEAAPTIDLKEEYFEEGFRLTETELSATVKSDSLKNLLSLTDDAIKSPINNLVLTMSKSDNVLSGMTISYSSGQSNVKITYEFTY